MNDPYASGTPDVTVVTVTYQGADLVASCLRSLTEQELGGVRMEVVVVDNASTDGTADIIARDFPDVRLLRNERNLGFAGGNDVALATVRSRYVILLNNDATADLHFVRELVEGMDAADPDVAAMAATVLLEARFRPARPEDGDVLEGPDGRWVTDPAGTVRLVNSTGNEVRSDGFGVDRGWLADARSHSPARAVFGISGAAAILRMSALERTGTFDERFFMYYEDTDLSWRLRLAGYRIEHRATAVVSHLHAASSREGSDFFRFHDQRNRLAMLTKVASAGMATRCVLRFVVTTASIGLRRRQPWPAVRTRLRALVSYLGMLPYLLRERRRIGRDANVSRGTVQQLLTRGQGTAGSYRA
ncbi:glycosyltransferase family 2 protein [Cellulomonas sp. P5_E12]